MTRESERRARRRDRWAQLVVVLIAVVAGLVAAAVGNAQGDASTAVADGTTPPTSAIPVPPTAPPDAAPTPAVVMLAHRGVDGRVDAVVVYGFADEGVGNALLVPTATMMIVPTFAQQAAADVHRLGGDALFELTVENALGVEIDEVVLLDNAQLAAVFSPAGLPDPALAPVADATGELDHVDTVRTAIEGWRTELRDEIVAGQVRLLDNRLATFVDLAGAEVTYSTLPVDPIEVEGDARFQIRSAEAAALVQDTMGYSAFADGVRPKVEIRDGTGDLTAVTEVGFLVVRAGGEVVRTDNVQGFGIAETQVTYHGENDQAAAARLAEALAVQGVTRAPQPVDDFDVTIVVGADFAPPP